MGDRGCSLLYCAADVHEILAGKASKRARKDVEEEPEENEEEEEKSEDDEVCDNLGRSRTCIVVCFRYLLRPWREMIHTLKATCSPYCVHAKITRCESVPACCRANKTLCCGSAGGVSRGGRGGREAKEKVCCSRTQLSCTCCVFCKW